MLVLPDDLTEEEIKSVLPKSAIELLDCISLRSVILLCETYGGIGLYLSKTESLRNDLVDLIGTDESDRLLSKFEGEEIFPPQLHKLKGLLRKREIFQCRKQGSAVTELALRFKLTENRIYQIIREYKRTTCVA